jgi:hypothetical protein
VQLRAVSGNAVEEAEGREEERRMPLARRQLRQEAQDVVVAGDGGRQFRVRRRLPRRVTDECAVALGDLRPVLVGHAVIVLHPCSRIVPWPMTCCCT